MDGYDPLAYMPSPLPFGNNMQHLDYLSAPSAVDPLDQYSNFDSETYLSGDEMSFPHSSGIRHPSLLKRLSSGFEDPFADGTLSQYDQLPMEGTAESTSMDRDSKYLSFSMPNFPYRLYNESFQQSYINISAQLHGMFFLAESQWPTTVDTAPPPPELTCYRRNLFQITGNVTLPRSLRYIFTEDGQRIPIYEIELSISATESVEGNTVKIISVPWKTPTGGESTKSEDKSEKEPPTIALDKLAGSDIDSDFHTIPIQWKRLQFRIATANNGRRKELQQHFTLHLKVMATVSTGEKFSIAESHSGAVIVRGRSPRNFAARKDLPLSSSSTSRKHVPSISRSTPAVTSAPQGMSGQKQQSPHEDAPRSLPAYESVGTPTPQLDLNGWQQHQQPFDDSLATSYSVPMGVAGPITFTGAPSPDMHAAFNFAFSPIETANVGGPVSLTFHSDDEGSPHPQRRSSRTSSKPPTSNPSPSLTQKPGSMTYGAISPALPSDPPNQRARLHSHQPSNTTVPSLSSLPLVANDMPTSAPGSRMPMLSSISDTAPLPYDINTLPYSPVGNSTDKFYEYFPLSIEDWQPPVDAVFRPHVVHHSGPIVHDLRSPLGGRSKRYFSEVV